MAEAAIPDVSLSTGSDSAIPDVSLSTGSDSAIPDVSLSTGSDSAIPDVSLSTGSEEIFDIECAPCTTDGQHKVAVSFCRDCGAHLCADCVRYHKKLPALKRHRLVDKPTGERKQQRGGVDSNINVIQVSSKVINISNLRASHRTDINVKTASNTNTCFITGMTVVSDDRIVAADWDNGTLKLIQTTSGKILSEHKTRFKPRDVTTYKDTVAATLPSHGKIVFLKHTTEFVHDREISVNGNCKGIDSYDDKLFVVFEKQKKLEVMTPTGVVLQTFSTTTQGEQLFDKPSHVTVSAANQRIYVSEDDMDRLIILDMAGNQTGTYDDGGLRYPKQLAVAGSGAMFLCDLGRNVHLLSPAGEIVKLLLTEKDGLGMPWSVCYCEGTGRLYVGTTFCTDADVIKTYKLKNQKVKKHK